MDGDIVRDERPNSVYTDAWVRMAINIVVSGLGMV